MSNTYRDDREAAHALAEALQRENAELRGQLARARDGDFGSTFAPPPTAAPVVAPEGPSARTLTVLMSGLVVGFSVLGTVVAMHPTQITVIAPRVESVAVASSDPVEVHTPSSGRFIPHPPSARTRYPDEHDVYAAMASVRPAVESCFQENWEYSTATVVFANTGSVEEVRLRPYNPENACIEAALRGVRIPAFTAPFWQTLQTFRSPIRRR